MDPFFIVFILIAVIVVAGGFFFERRRTKALREVAEKLGLQFEKNSELSPHISGLDFHLFSLGSDSIENVMSGTRDGSVWLFLLHRLR